MSFPAKLKICCWRAGHLWKNCQLPSKQFSQFCQQNRRIVKTKCIQSSNSIVMKNDLFQCTEKFSIPKVHYTSNDFDTDQKNSIKLKEASESQSQESEAPHVDVDKVIAQYNIEEFYGVEAAIEPEKSPPKEETLPISLERGVNGVFDVGELVTVLQEEKILDVCVIRVPEAINYVEYMVIGTGKSTRQLLAIAEHIRWIWKKKRNSEDPTTVFIEGKQSDDWVALDMGNIALHLFLKNTRELYDLETLWTCGAEYDKQSQSQDISKYSQSLSYIFSQNLSLKETKEWFEDSLSPEKVVSETGSEDKVGSLPDWTVALEDDSVKSNIENNDMKKGKLLRKVGYEEGESMENTSGYHPVIDRK